MRTPMRIRMHTAVLPAIVGASAALSILLASGCEPTNEGYAPEQPIAYSHAVHAGALQVPCMYCHFGADRGRYAGIPPASVCMNCHTQVLPDHPEINKIKTAIAEDKPIEWVRVHRVPDHTYFNHKAHVRAQVACQTCHGPVETMARVEQFAPLTMGWCLECHRAQPGAETETAAVSRLTDCVVCHH